MHGGLPSVSDSRVSELNRAPFYSQPPPLARRFSTAQSTWRHPPMARVSRDMVQAVSWYEKAAALGEKSAQKNLKRLVTVMGSRARAGDIMSSPSNLRPRSLARHAAVRAPSNRWSSESTKIRRPRTGRPGSQTRVPGAPAKSACFSKAPPSRSSSSWSCSLAPLTTATSSGLWNGG